MHPQEPSFDHEKLEVYRESISFIAWLSSLLEQTVRTGDVRDQLDRASTSVPLKIAEGNGKYTPKDRCRFFDIAHGSALECAAALDILVAKARLTPDQIRPGKESLQKIVRMLIGLIKRNSTRDYDKTTPDKGPVLLPRGAHRFVPLQVLLFLFLLLLLIFILLLFILIFLFFALPDDAAA